MQGMLAGDAAIYDPVHTFDSHLDAQLPVSPKTPGAKPKRLRDRVDEEVVIDVEAWLPKFEAAALKAGRQAAVDREIQAEEATQEETHLRTYEMSHLVLAGTARHLAVRDLLKPRVGSNPDENLAAMVDMRQRIDDHAKEIAEAGVKLKLDPPHSAAEVKKQAAAHRVATDKITALRKQGGVSQQELDELRKEGESLQTRINVQVRAAIPGSRAKQVEFGLTEREHARPASSTSQPTTPTPSEPPQPPPAPAPTPGPATASAPATPGPVASGQAGTPTPSTAAPTAPAGTGTPANPTQPPTKP